LGDKQNCTISYRLWSVCYANEIKYSEWCVESASEGEVMTIAKGEIDNADRCQAFAVPFIVDCQIALYYFILYDASLAQRPSSMPLRRLLPLLSCPLCAVNGDSQSTLSCVIRLLFAADTRSARPTYKRLTPHNIVHCPSARPQKIPVPLAQISPALPESSMSPQHLPRHLLDGPRPLPLINSSNGSTSRSAS
jgi:hypothetical protein